MIRVHHDEWFVKSSHGLRIGNVQRAFEFPLSWAEIVVIQANSLPISGRTVEKHHAPTFDFFVPNNARVAADSPITLLPLEDKSAAGPVLRYAETGRGLSYYGFVLPEFRRTGAGIHR